MDKYLIDGHKLLWHHDRVSEWHGNRLIPPIYLEVSPISFCNHNCIFCGIDFAKQQKFQLDKEIFLERLVEMAEIGIKSIMFAGEGEPLLHNDILPFVKTASINGIDVSITTNGTLGNYRLWNEMLPYLTWIRFSIDSGTPETFAKVHGVSKLLFNKTVKNIIEAIKIKNNMNLNSTIGIQFLIIEENLDDIDNSLKLFSDIGVDYISLKPFSQHPQMLNKQDVTYTEKMLNKVDDIVNKYKSDTIDIIFRKESFRKYLSKDKSIKNCRALPFWGYISSNGDFYTCSVFLGNKSFYAGNINKEDMKSIIFGQAREQSIIYGEKHLNVANECRLNCRMARVNEFLEQLENKPEHINFI